MPALSQLMDIKRKRLLKALVRLGFRVEPSGGKGDHYKVIYRNEKAVIIDDFDSKMKLKYIVEEIEEISGITWEDIKREL